MLKEFKVRRFGIGLLAVMVLGAVFLSGYVLGQHRGPLAEAASSGMRVLAEVQAILDSNFMGDIPAADVQERSAIRGLVSAYNDRFTVYVEPVSREIERDELRGHFGGIGAYLGRNEAGDMQITVMRDRPAAKAGVQDGDFLLAVDDTPITAQMSVDEVVALVRGEVGKAVTLTLRREGVTEPIKIDVVRERIETPTVEWRVLDDESHIGYARLNLFSERTAEELAGALRELNVAGVNKLVFDLRGNGGGLLQSAVDVASLLIPDGDVLREMKRNGQERYYAVKPVSSPAYDWELVVLTDGGTASASEIVAGALRDNGRATLIGEKSFGKGSVQEVHELSDGSSLHVTVARWLTPNRVQIDGAGLEPDISVSVSSEDRDAGRDPQLARAEAWLRGKR
jgi:carboxyl-terminal processing protease